MCNFFSFISRGDGIFLYADAKLRKNKEFAKYEPDSHTSLAVWFHPEHSAVADDKVNKYEFSGGEFKVDQINVHDDSAAAEAWVKKFAGSKEFEAICRTAVKENGLALYYVKKQTPAICLAAVKQYGFALKYVETQTPALCLAAVKQNGCALYYVEKQTPAICLAAVKQDGYALKYVKKQTPAICRAAINSGLRCAMLCSRSGSESRY